MMTPGLNPDPPVPNDPFYTSRSNSESVSASNASRCFSSFNQSDAESAPPEVNSTDR